MKSQSQKKFALHFQGYWKGDQSEYFPQEPGVLCIHAGRNNPERVIFFAETLNLRGWFEKTKNWEALKSRLMVDEHLYFSFAPLVFGREQALAALVYRHKPIANDQYKFHFPFETTELLISGKSGRICPRVIVPDLEDKNIESLLQRFTLSKTG